MSPCAEPGNQDPRRRTPPSRLALLAAAGALPAAFPTVACANVGSPMMLLTAHHLLFGNALIGIVEAVVISIIWRAPFLKAAAWMILANYVSMLFALIMLVPLHALVEVAFPGPPIETAIPTLITMVMLAIVLSIALEWPFCRLSLPAGSRTWRAGWRASIAAHVVSYAALTPIYLGSAQLSFFARLDVVPYAHFADRLTAFNAYTIDPDTSDVVRVDFTPGGVVREAIPSFGECVGRASLPMLRIEQTESEPPRLRRNDGDADDPWCTVLTLDASIRTPELLSLERSGEAWTGVPDPDAFLYTFRHRAWHDLREPERRTWFPTAALFAGESLAIDRPNERWARRFGFETLWQRWNFRSPNALPGDLLIVEAEEQLIVIDVNASTVAYLGPGMWPVVVENP